MTGTAAGCDENRSTRGPSALTAALGQALSGVEGIDGVSGALVVSRDGLLVAGTRPVLESMEVQAAMAAAVFAAVGRASDAIAIGPVRATLVETSSHSLQILSLAELLLVVFASKGTNMTRVRLAMAKAAISLTRAASL